MTPPAGRSTARLKLQGRRAAESDRAAVLAPLLEVLAWHIARAVGRRALAGDPRSAKLIREEAAPVEGAMTPEEAAIYEAKLADPDGWLLRERERLGLSNAMSGPPPWEPPPGSYWKDGVLIIPPPPQEYLDSLRPASRPVAV